MSCDKRIDKGIVSPLALVIALNSHCWELMKDCCSNENNSWRGFVLLRIISA